MLAAAAQAGVTIASSCSQGMCGTCKLTQLSGEVEMNHQGGIRAKEIMGRGGWKSMALVVRYGTPRKRAMRSWPRR